MASDKNGASLEPGDLVTIRARVIAVKPGLYDLVVETVELLVPELAAAGEPDPNSHFTTFELAGRQVERA